jgi:hypothetical protein
VGARNPASCLDLPVTLGLVAVSCALTGFVAFNGYGSYAIAGIYAVMARDSVTARRMATYADCFTAAQQVLGVLALGLGWVARVQGKGSRLANGARNVSLGTRHLRAPTFVGPRVIWNV